VGKKSPDHWADKDTQITLIDEKSKCYVISKKPYGDSIQLYGNELKKLRGLIDDALDTPTLEALQVAHAYIFQSDKCVYTKQQTLDILWKAFGKHE